jgi:hypothetical protein
LSTQVRAELNKEDSVNSVTVSGPPIITSSIIDFPSPRNSFWNLFSKNVIEEPLRSIGSPLVPIYCLFRYIFSILQGIPSNLL